MKKLFLLGLIFTSAFAFAQGGFIPPQTALKNINGIVMPIANATITVCGPAASGIPCSPALLNTIFKDGGLIQPLPNPFTADANGNYQFAAAAGTYTVTVTAAGFAGYSYQVTTGAGTGTIGGSGTVNNYSGWLDSSHLQNAPATYSGNDSSFNGKVNAAGAVSAGGGPATPCGVGVTGCMGINETSTAGTPLAGLDYIRADAVSHTLKCSQNGAAETPCIGGSGGGNPQLENCTPDQTGNSFYSVASLTNYFFGHWEFVFGQASATYCTIFIPTGPGVSKQIVLDVEANDGVAGHTANFQTCDGVINSGTINIGALACAANQTFTTTSTAYNRVTLTFAVQSTLSNNSILVVKIATSTTGTAPTANMLVYAHFLL